MFMNGRETFPQTKVLADAPYGDYDTVSRAVPGCKSAANVSHVLVLCAVSFCGVEL